MVDGIIASDETGAEVTPEEGASDPSPEIQADATAEIDIFAALGAVDEVDDIAQEVTPPVVPPVEETPKEPAAAETPATVPPVEPTAPETPAVPAAEAAPVTEPVKPEVPAAPEQPAPQDPTQAAASTPATELDTLIHNAQERAPELVQHLANTLFKLSPEVVEELETDAVAAIPKLFADSYVRQQTATLQMMQQLLPGMIQHHVTQTQAQTSATDRFFEAFPDLKDAKFHQQVSAAAQTYRQFNPQADEATLIQQVGAMVMSMHGLQAAAPQAAPAGNGAVPPAGTVVQQQAAPGQTAFKPAATGKVRSETPVDVLDEFGAMGQTFDED